jgi:hypothetical protein
MRRLVLLFLFVSVCPYLAAGGMEREGKFTKHYADSILKVSDKGLYSVEMLIIGNQLKIGMNSIDMIVHDSEDHDVMGAEVTVTPWMPEMGHGAKEEPKVMERGGGLYSAENVDISMPGLWELRVKVRAEGGEDTAVFSFPDVHAAGMAHEHMPTFKEVPKGLSISKIATSQNGSFRVAYLSDAMPVPINKVHGWRVYVETADGKPVTDAEISIGGDMPEHGHGMPTRPRVARNLGGGVYEVEGMKFQMPGWWVVNLTISSGGVRDRVTFNLMLE